MSNIVEFVKQQEQLFCGALTEQTVTWAKESQFAIQYFQKNDYLAKTALANPTSAQNAIINVAAIGITLNLYGIAPYCNGVWCYLMGSGKTCSC